MRVIRTLPGASPKTVVQLVLELLDADKATVFTQQTLATAGVSQNRQGLALLGFLNLLTSAGGLREDVLCDRGNPEHLREVLRRRVIDGCGAAGCAAADLDGFGTNQLTENQVAEVVRALPAVQARGNKSVVSNIVSCLRALHTILAQGCKREFLEDELARFGTRHTASPRFDSRAAGRNSHKADAPLNADLCQQTGVQTRAASANLAHPRVASSTEIETRSYAIDFDGNQPVYAQVFYPGDLDDNKLERLALQLLYDVQKRLGRSLQNQP
jgi:hypothetical protein